jgi:uncharacterized protein (DUF58 family)
VVDATLSMAYRGKGAPGAKIAFAALLAAALGRVALASGDPVGVGWIGGEGARGLPASAGREAFERIVGVFESASAAGDTSGDIAAVERALGPIGRKARRGSIVVLFSDLLDLPPRALASFASLATGGRAPIAVRVLDPTERKLDFTGNVRLRAMEGREVVEADADVVRDAYQARLASIADEWSRELVGRGGRLLDVSTTDKPAEIVRALVQAIAEARR